MTPSRKLLTATLVAVALCAGTFAAAPAQAADNTCLPLLLDLDLSPRAARRPASSRTAAGPRAASTCGHPQCGWTSAGLATVEGTDLATLAGEAACMPQEPAAEPAPEAARAAAR